MALTANANYTTRKSSFVNPEVGNALEVYNGALMHLGSRDHGTAALRGRCGPWTGADGEIPLGFAFDRTTGDTAATPIPTASVDTTPRIMFNQPVTGLTGDVTDVGRLVYATDDNTWTLTRPATSVPIGIVIRWISATNADVYFYGFLGTSILSMAGACKYTWNLGTIGVLVGGGNALTGIVAPHHGRIIDVYGIAIDDMADADADYDINLEIGGVNVTGGVVEWLFSDAVGTKKQGTAVTANNVFHEGDLIDVELVENTAGAAGDGHMNIYAEVLMEPGL